MPSPDPAPSFVRKTAGFSLVEVVMAVGIVAFCLLAIVGLADRKRSETLATFGPPTPPRERIFPPIM